MNQSKNNNFFGFALLITGILVEDRYLKYSLLAGSVLLFVVSIIQQRRGQ